MDPSPRLPEISEDQLAQDQPRVRALQVQRLEQIWDRVQERIVEDRQGERPCDPRLLEIGLRVIKEQSQLYRLAKPQTQLEEEEDPALLAIDRAKLVEEQLQLMETRIKEQEAEAAVRKAAEAEAAEEHAAAGHGPGGDGVLDVRAEAAVPVSKAPVSASTVSSHSALLEKLFSQTQGQGQ